MAITHNTSDHGDCISSVSVSKNVVVGAGSNIAALIGISWVEESAASAYVSSVTFGGTEATFVHLSSGPAGTVEQYYVTGVTAGTKALIVAWTGDSPPVVITGVVGIEVMNGVDPTTPIGTVAVGVGNSTLASIIVPTTDTSGLVVDTLLVQQNTSAATTAGAGQTERWNSVIGTAPTRIVGHGSTETGSASGTTMSWSIASARAWVLAGVEFRPFVETPEPPVSDVNVRTSYDYLEVSPDKLDRNDRLPEEARMVWIGKWRH